MKKFFLMSLCFCMFMGAAVVTSCSDDDEEKLAIDMSTLTEGVEEGDNSIKATAISDGVAIIITATFDNDDKCNSFIQQFVFASEAEAQQAWVEFQKELEEEEEGDLEGLSINSNVITWDRTSEFEGMPKSELSRDITHILENY